MNNEAGTNLGMNLTGAMMSPKDSVLTAEGAIELTKPVPDGDASAFAENRIRYIKEADALGTVPMPGTLKGTISAVQEKIMNGNHVFMDKLGERIAFERTGTRLYEALLSKYQGSEDQSMLPPLGILEQFHLEEMRHFHLACSVMKKIGGDPTAMTPSADICGMSGMGWVQVMSDPRTSFKQCLEIILQAELVDNACWEVLIELSQGTGLKDIAQEFQKAYEEEAVHLATVKQWVRELNLNGKVDLSSNKNLKH